MSSDYGGQPIKEYDESDWFDEAVYSEIPRDEEVRTAGQSVSGTRNFFWKNSNNYKQSNWYKFQEAVIEHQNETIDYLKDNNPEYMSRIS